MNECVQVSCSFGANELHLPYDKSYTMSHDTHGAPGPSNRTVISFKNSFWLVVILVGLFIAALNFVQAESEPEEGGHEATHEMHHATGEHAAAPAEAHEAAATEAEGKEATEAKPAAEAPKEEAHH